MKKRTIIRWVFFTAHRVRDGKGATEGSSAKHRSEAEP